MRVKALIVAAAGCGLWMVGATTLVTAARATDLMQRTAEDFRWHGFVPTGSAVEIKGVNGDVKAVAGSGPDVEVVAVRKGRRNDPEEVRIEVVEHGRGTTLCAVYPSRPGDRPNECKPGDEGRMNVQNNDVNVTFTVRVPPGVLFTGRTVNGDVEADALASAVSLKTVNGSASFSTSSYGEASTVNGSIRGAMGATDWTADLDFTTVNGSITLDLPGNLSTTISARTVNGDITTDFPMTVTGRVNPRRLDGTIGAGGRTISLDTVNGSVRLRRR
jgi:hypothetical protein